MVGEATDAIVVVVGQDLGALGDVAFAVVALYFVGGVENVLNESHFYIVTIRAIFSFFLANRHTFHLLPRLLVRIDQKFPELTNTYIPLF